MVPGGIIPEDSLILSQTSQIVASIMPHRLSLSWIYLAGPAGNGMLHFCLQCSQGVRNVCIALNAE